MDLFNQNSEKREFQKLKLKDGEVWFMENFLSLEKAGFYFKNFTDNINWKQEEIKIFGKTHLVPRKTAWYGNQGTNYTYSGILSHSEKWTRELLELKEDIESLLNTSPKFNSVLLNLYRDGNDKVGWHADNEKELGNNPVIASVSLGAQRRFDLKHRSDPNKKLQLQLNSGSLVIMKGELQHHWLHQIPKQKRVIDPRINLTYRHIVM